MVWVLLLASASAVLIVGLLATLVLFGRVGSLPRPPWTFWPRLLALCVLTIVSLSLRSLRWIFLLRRSETRIPIRDAYIGYFAGLSLLFAPLLLGEIAIRAAILRARGRVPVLATAVVNTWERMIDLLSLALVAAVLSAAAGEGRLWMIAVPVAWVLMFVPAFRRFVLAAIVSVAAWLTRLFEAPPPPTFERLTETPVWLMTAAVSLVIWLIPGLAFWLLAGAWGPGFGPHASEQAYAHAAVVAGVSLAPGGVLVAGPDMLATMAAHGIPEDVAVLIVFGVRLATAGLSIALGVVFVAIHLRTARADSATHFDDIADAYDVQIPEARREALLGKKTTLMREVLQRRTAGLKGLDVGCGQGAYVARMRELGFDVSGIDASAGQVRLAARNVGQAGVVQVGSVLEIPAADASYDFLYVINVLHHLNSIDDQRKAFAELFRVLKPGGLLFVHEINTRNVLFRFYMGYVFPSLNCIDEGVERWLLPDKMGQYTSARVVDIRYFTFLPDFVPRPIVRAFSPVERALESSPLRAYSAHYVAVLEKERPRVS